MTFETIGFSRGAVPGGLWNFINELRRTDRQLLETKLAEHCMKVMPNRSFSFFASGRAAFLTYLRHQNLKGCDEILIPAGTCSVMVDAILSLDLRPVFYDMDPSNLSGGLVGAQKKLNQKTQVIVIQHSFGIPSSVIEHVEYFRSKGLLVVEDCALAIGSKFEGRHIGTFGDAAILSFGHTKPISGFIGGALAVEPGSDLANYTCPTKLSVSQLSLTFAYLIFEHFFARVGRYWIMKLLLLATGLTKRLIDNWNPYLATRKKNGSIISAQQQIRAMPNFSLLLAIKNFEQWEIEGPDRAKNLKYFLDVVESSQLPKAYFDKRLQIEPFRFAWVPPYERVDSSKLKRVLDVSQIWPKEAIESADRDLAEYFYEESSCPVAEQIGKRIINLPHWLDQKRFASVLNNALERVVENDSR